MPVTTIALGDYPAGSVIDFHFTSFASDGTPTALGLSSVNVYKGNSLAQSVSGVSLSPNFDSVTGLNQVRIDTNADGTFYATGNEFSVVIAAGTIAGISAAGYVVSRFTLGRLGPVVLASTGLDAVVIETDLNARQALSIIAAADSGDITAVDNSDGTWTFAIAGAGVATARIVALASTITKERDVTITPPT